MKCLILFSTLLALTLGQTLVLIGGNLRDDNAPIWNKMVELAGGVGVARIGVISASTTFTKEGAKVVENFIRIYRVKSAVEIPLTIIRANDLAVAEMIRNLTGIFIVEDSDVTASFNIINWFTSLVRPSTDSYEPPVGVVCYEGPSFKRQNLIDILRPSGVDSPVLSAIKSVLNRGGMVAGNAAIMSKPALILDGDSISALVSGTRFISFPRVPLTFNKQGGLGLLNIDYVVESRLSEKGREVRLMRTLLDNDISRGIGVDENTAFIVNNPLFQPVGKVITASRSTSGLFYMDVSDIPTPSISNALYENVTFSFFSVNDTIDLTTGEVTYAYWKSPIAGKEWFKNAVPSNDILSRSSPHQWRQTARRLIDCKETTVTSYSPSSVVPMVPRVQVIFDRSGAVGYGADLPGDVNNTYVASFRQMLVTVKVLGIL